MRTRSRGGINTVQCEIATGSVNGVSSDSSGIYHCKPWPDFGSRRTFEYKRDTTEVITDHVTPGYFRKVREKEPLPVNPLTHVKRVVDLDHCSINASIQDSEIRPGYAKCYRARVQASGSFPGNPDFGGSLPYVNDSAVLTEALAKANAASFDVLTFATEFHKTQDLVRGAGERFDQRTDRIINHMKSKRRSKRAKLWQLMDEFSQMWLENRYGWRILAYDIESVAEAYQKLEELGKSYTRVTASESASSSDGPSPPDYPMIGVYTRGYRETKVETRAGVCIKTLMNSPFSVDPLVTAWEVIPFSFILDWFVNVGDNIGAYSPFASAGLQWSFVSREITRTYTGEYSTEPLKPDATGHVPWTTGLIAREITKTRTAENPAFSIEFRPNLDLFKAADLTSIFVAIAAKRLRALRRLAI